jgi:hypothetical protein
MGTTCPGVSGVAIITELSDESAVLKIPEVDVIKLCSPSVEESKDGHMSPCGCRKPLRLGSTNPISFDWEALSDCDNSSFDRGRLRSFFLNPLANTSWPFSIPDVEASIAA